MLSIIWNYLYSLIPLHDPIVLFISEIFSINYNDQLMWWQVWMWWTWCILIVPGDSTLWLGRCRHGKSRSLAVACFLTRWTNIISKHIHTDHQRRPEIGKVGYVIFFIMLPTTVPSNFIFCNDRLFVESFGTFLCEKLFDVKSAYSIAPEYILMSKSSLFLSSTSCQISILPLHITIASNLHCYK